MSIYTMIYDDTEAHDIKLLSKLLDKLQNEEIRKEIKELIDVKSFYQGDIDS